MKKIVVSGQHLEIVSDTEAGEQRVHGAKLNARPAAAVANLGRFHVRVSVRTHERDDREALEDGVVGASAAEALKQLLQNEARRGHGLASEESLLEAPKLVGLIVVIPSQGERPDARVDEEIQGRERSAL